MRRTRTDKEEDVRMRKRMSRRTEKDKKEEEASKCYFRYRFCLLIYKGGLRRRGRRLRKTVKRRTEEDEEEGEDEEVEED